MKMTKVIPLALMVACSHAETTPSGTPATPLESARAQTPSEQTTAQTDVVAPNSAAVVAAGETTTIGPRFVVSLDKAIGERVSQEGDSFTATVVAPRKGKSILPEGTKVAGRVIKVYPSMTGTAGFVRLVIDGIQRDKDIQYFDGRVVGVELNETASGRPVNATGPGSAEVVGSMIAEKNLPPFVDLNRDPLGRGTAISLGSGGDQQHQLDKSSRMVIELRGPLPGDRVAVSGPGDITNYSQLGGKDVIGREVELASVPVESVIGDVVFWIGKDKAHRTLVVLDKLIDTPESHIQVRAGERVTLSAVVERMPAASEAPRLWKLVTPAEAAETQGHPFYLFAYRAKVVK